MDLDAIRIFDRIRAAEELASRPRRNENKDADPTADHWSMPVLRERVAYLRKLARAGQGDASEVLRSYPGHAAQLSVRLRSGVAEFHQRFADLFIVIEGRATLVTGGSIADAREVGPGEIRGSSVEGGARRELHAGDVAHVPAATPHQMLLSGSDTFAAMVLKIEEPVEKSS